MTARSFLPWREPVLPAAGRLLAERYAASGSLNLGRVLVALPAARAGRRLVERLIEEATSRGLVLTPPETVTVGHLPERLYRPDRRTAGAAESRAAWARALRELAPARRAAVFPRAPEDDDLPGWTELARRVQALHVELAGEGLRFEDVAHAFRRGTGFDDSGRWSVLADAARAHGRLLASLGSSDREAERWRAVHEGRIELDRDLFLVGVVELPRVTRAMLEAVEAPVTAFVHAPESLADAFDPLGCVDPAAWSDRRIDLPDEALHVAGRPPEQADEVVRALSGPGAHRAPDQVTIGVPDPELVPYLEQRLGAYGVPHRSAAGTPLPRTDPYRLLEGVADYLEDRRYPAFAALLRHPVVEARMDLPGALEASDRVFAKRLPARVDGRLEDARAGSEPLGHLAGAIDRALALGRLDDRRAVSEWMPEILSLLARAYEGRPLDRSRPGDRRLVEACEAVREAAAALARVHPDLDGSCAAPAAIRLLLAELRGGAVPPMPDRSAVELLGWLELHLDDAPVLVLTGLDEAHVPGSVDSDLFLPDALRTRLGLADDARRHARDVYLLTAMLASREEVHVVAGRRTADGDPLRPSRLLLAAEGEPLARRVVRLFEDAPGRRARLPRPGMRTADRSAFRLPPQPAIEVRPVPPTLPVTAFRLLLERPYQYALGHLLALEEVDDRAREMDALLFGELAHRVLRGFGSGDAARSTDPEAIDRALGALLDRAALDQFGRSPMPAVRLQVEQLRRRLRGFAEWQATWLREGWETVAVELETPKSGVPFPVDDQPMMLTGRIDRIDYNARTGSWAVLDYKTSARPRTPEQAHRRRGGAWRDLQLPLYRHLLPGLSEAGALPEEAARPDAALRLGYVNVSRGETADALARWTDDDLADADEAARACVRLLRSGRIEYRADEPVAPYSPFGGLLGRGRLVPGGDGEAGPEEGDTGGHDEGDA
jgi:ATP-dependent helicase/nuclease subunit B